MEPIMQRLKDIRIAKGLTQLEMAKMLGVTVGTYRNWELGANDPNEINMYRIKEILEIKQ